MQLGVPDRYNDCAKLIQHAILCDPLSNSASASKNQYRSISESRLYSRTEYFVTSEIHLRLIKTKDSLGGPVEGYILKKEVNRSNSKNI